MDIRVIEGETFFLEMQMYSWILSRWGTGFIGTVKLYAAFDSTVQQNCVDLHIGSSAYITYWCSWLIILFFHIFRYLPVQSTRVIKVWQSSWANQCHRQRHRNKRWDVLHHRQWRWHGHVWYLYWQSQSGGSHHCQQGELDRAYCWICSSSVKDGLKNIRIII